MGNAGRAGAVFVVLFVAAFVVSLGDLVGTFADPDEAFVDHFADEVNRVRDIAGSYLLAFAGLAFAWFAQTMSLQADVRRVPILVAGSIAGGAMVVAAAAFATVPMSLWFGSLVDDPGLQQGQAVLPQLGYVLLGLGAMVPAAAFMMLVASSSGLLPRWLTLVSYPAAALVSVTALLFMPLFVFTAWVIASAATHARPGTP
jgi:hypothetical protein